MQVEEALILDHKSPERNKQFVGYVSKYPKNGKGCGPTTLAYIFDLRAGEPIDNSPRYYVRAPDRREIHPELVGLVAGNGTRDELQEAVAQIDPARAKIEWKYA